MLSRNGRSTINYYKVFQQSLSDDKAVPSTLSETANMKHHKLLQVLSFVPEDVFNESILNNLDQNDIKELSKIA